MIFDPEGRNSLAEWDYRDYQGASSKGYGRGDVHIQGVDNLSELERERMLDHPDNPRPADARYPASNVL